MLKKYLYNFSPRITFGSMVVWVLLVGAVLGFYFFSRGENISLHEGERTSQSSDEIQFTRVFIGDTIISAEIVETQEDRERGLSGRIGLAPDTGMLFLWDAYGAYAIWMKDMKFPIDIVWIADNQIVDVKKRVPPPLSGTPDADLLIYRPRKPANRILEIPAGFAEAHGIRNGESVIIEY